MHASPWSEQRKAGSPRTQTADAERTDPAYTLTWVTLTVPMAAPPTAEADADAVAAFPIIMSLVLTKPPGRRKT